MKTVRLRELDERIEALRARLYALAAERNYRFLDGDVMRLSERLDALLVRRERYKMKCDKE